MKTRIAKKILAAVYAYKTFETNRQPYTPAQQRIALRVLHLPLNIRHIVRISNKVKNPKEEVMPWEM